MPAQGAFAGTGVTLEISDAVVQMYQEHAEKAKREKLRQLGYENNGQDALAEGGSMVENTTVEVESDR